MQVAPVLALRAEAQPGAQVQQRRRAERGGVERADAHVGRLDLDRQREARRWSRRLARRLRRGRALDVDALDAQRGEVQQQPVRRVRRPLQAQPFPVHVVQHHAVLLGAAGQCVVDAVGLEGAPQAAARLHHGEAGHALEEPGRAVLGARQPGQRREQQHAGDAERGQRPQQQPADARQAARPLRRGGGRLARVGHRVLPRHSAMPTLKCRRTLCTSWP